MMVVVVGDQGEVVGMAAGVGVVVRVVAEPVILFATSSTRCASPAVILTAGLAVVPVMVDVVGGVVVLTTRATTLSTATSTGDMVVEAMLTVASASSKILEG